MLGTALAQASAAAQAAAADTVQAAADSTALAGIRDKVERIQDLISPGEIVLMLALLAATHYLIKLVSVLTRVIAARLPRHRLFVMQLLPIARMALWLLAAYLVVFGIIEPSREALLAFSATAGVGIGFAAQDVLRNIFGGLVIVIDRPFQVGDLVDIAGYHGEVVGIGLRATRIRTRNDEVISVPNAEVMSQPVKNANAGALDCMVVVELLLPSLVDLTKVRRIAYEAAATSPFIYAAKPIRVRIEDEFRETFLTKVRIQAYVYDHRLEHAFASDVAERAKRAFLAEGLLPDEVTLGLDPEDQRRYLVASGPAPADPPAGDAAPGRAGAAAEGA
ncbi:MAG TPA: mechanosensitive ion channel domain-containing protein [Longimicrobiales bacterium]